MAYLEEHKVFNEDEIRDIVKIREEHEYRMIKNSSKKLDFLEAI